MLVAALSTGAAERAPAVLVHCPRASPDQWGFWVDLDYLKELRERGFEVDYTDQHSDFTWERVRRYDVLVLYVCPLAVGGYYDNTPDAPPYRDEFVSIVERFLAEGGGVFLMARSIDADESFLPLLERWGARIAHERIEERDPARLAVTPRMGGRHRLWFVDDVPESPVSRGVSQVWLPLTPHYASLETMAVDVTDDWRVVLRGSGTSRAGPLERPALAAIRAHGAGRIAFCAVWPQYSLGQGTKWLYDRRVRERGVGDRPSHVGRLVENLLRWLAEPNGRSVGGYETDAGRLVMPNLRPGAREAFLARSARRPDGARRLATALARGTIVRGLIGARIGDGPASREVARYARAARETGLSFVAFLQDGARLDDARLAELREACIRQSTPDLALYAGYAMETNTGNGLFLFGPGVELPPAELRSEGRLNQQRQDPRSGEVVEGPAALVDWLGHRMMNGRRVAIGYFGFDDRPHAQSIDDLRLYSMLALTLHRDGRRVEDQLEAYLANAAGTLPPAPVAVHLLDSPRALERAARERRGLTYARVEAPEKLWSALAYPPSYESPNVFVSDGPLVEVWPGVQGYSTFAAEDFAARAAYLPVPLAVSSPAGLDEVRVYDGPRLLRRFDARGATRLRDVLELPASEQRTLILVARDRAGGRAVSSALRTYKFGERAIGFCGDRINDCKADGLMARGPGMLPVAIAPEIDGGATWDGGPLGARPALRLGRALRPQLVSDLGREGERGFANRPQLVLADEGVVRVRAILDRVYAARVPVVNPWHTFGPLGGSSRLLRAEARLTVFDRPSLGPRPAGPAGFASGYGAAVSRFESDITFLRDQTVESLDVLAQEPHDGPFPLWLVHGRGDEVIGRYELRPGAAVPRAPRLATGDWLGCFGDDTLNLSVHLNRGQPLDLAFRTGPATVSTAFRAAVEPAAVREGQRVHVDILSAVDPLDAPRGGLERVLEIARALMHVEGLTGGPAAPHLGIIELDAHGESVALALGRPSVERRVPVPVEVRGLEPGSSAGVFLERGYVLGNYGSGENRYRALGVDEQGRSWLAIDPDLAPETRVVVGHPVVCDRQDAIVQVTLREDPPAEGHWHVSVHNPGPTELRTSCHAAMRVPGLDLEPAEVTVPAGGRIVLR